jgi:NTP pyrophosphatase (non-canonical NTP hydrolase)
MDINQLVDKCYSQAEALGWTEKPVSVVEQIALIHSEASEALESFRNNEPLSWTDDKGKPQGIASEYADIVIRIGHYAKALGIDMEYEITRKLAYNMTRGHRHGGKAI